MFNRTALGVRQHRGTGKSRHVGYAVPKKQQSKIQNHTPHLSPLNFIPCTDLLASPGVPLTALQADKMWIAVSGLGDTVERCQPGLLDPIPQVSIVETAATNQVQDLTWHTAARYDICNFGWVGMVSIHRNPKFA